jgi:hypothetical protein
MKTMIVRFTMAAILIAGFTCWFLTRKASAQPRQLGFGQSLCISQVPSSWGEFKGGSAQTGLSFQDSAGTLRFVTNVPCDGTPQVALEIRRTR